MPSGWSELALQCVSGGGICSVTEGMENLRAQNPAVSSPRQRPHQEHAAERRDRDAVPQAWRMCPLPLRHDGPGDSPGKSAYARPHRTVATGSISSLYLPSASLSAFVPWISLRTVQ
ncbi:hypothetical protein MTO96_025710 [Rhipicephalus appendiculatus]